MKILVVLPRFPYPLEKGDKLRAFHQLRTLSQSHEIFLVALYEANLPPASIEKLQPFCVEIHAVKLTLASKLFHTTAAFFRGLPLQCGYFYRSAAQKVIDEIAKRVRPDRIYCQLIRTTEYVKDIQIKKILDYQDVLSKGMQRRSEIASAVFKPFFNCEYRRLLRYEEYIFPFFDEKVIITEVDRNLIPHPESARIHVVANGVDFATFKELDCPKEYDLIFSGNMGYAPNIEAAEYLAKEIVPQLIMHFPDLKLAICGANPSPKVQSLRSEHVIVTGWVDNMADFYAKSRIFIAPMHLGTGLQNKLLEALAMRIPCITSELAGAPLKGIQNGKEIVICSTTIGYVEAVRLLLENPVKYAEIAENGYQFVCKNYNWETINQQLDKILTD